MAKLLGREVVETSSKEEEEDMEAVCFGEEEEVYEGGEEEEVSEERAPCGSNEPRWERTSATISPSSAGRTSPTALPGGMPEASCRWPAKRLALRPTRCGRSWQYRRLLSCQGCHRRCTASLKCAAS